MKTKEKLPKASLEFQQQLNSTLNRIVDARTQLISDVAVLANDGKDKEWPNINSKIKFIKNKLAKEPNNVLYIICEMLKDMEVPIIKLEEDLELKNFVLRTITEQSFQEEKPSDAV